MTTTAGYIRQIESIIANNQHVIHNTPNVVDLLVELAACIKSLQKSQDFWVDQCAQWEGGVRALIQQCPCRGKEPRCLFCGSLVGLVKERTTPPHGAPQ